MPKPTTAISPNWAETGTIVEPSGSKRNTGWTSGEKPAYEFFNWFWNHVCQWLAYLESITDGILLEIATFGTMAVQGSDAVAITGGTMADVAITGGTVGSLDSPVAVADGGTGADNAGDARSNLGLGSMAVVNSPVPVANGGTGSTTAGDARSNLGLTGALLGDSTDGRVIRISTLRVYDGTNLDTIKCQLVSSGADGWNGDTADTFDNLDYDETADDFGLSADGYQLTLLNNAISGVPVAVVSAFIVWDSSGLSIAALKVYSTGADIVFKAYDAAGAEIDLTTIASGKWLFIKFCYITSA